MTTKVNSNLIGNTEVHFYHLNSDIFGTTSTSAARGSNTLELNVSGSLTGGGTITLGSGGSITVGYTEPTNPEYSKITVTDGGVIDGFGTTVSGTTPTTISSYTSSIFGGAKFIILAVDQATGVRQTTEIITANTPTSVKSTEYGTVSTGSHIASFETNISSGIVNLIAIGFSSNTVKYKVFSTFIPN